MNILLIEDNYEASEPLKLILESFSHKVKVMPDGEEALDLLKVDEDIQLIILDHFLPGMSGLAFLSKLRSSSSKNLPVILATGAEDIKLEKLEEYKPVTFLKKPFDPEYLIRIISSISLGESHE